MTGEIKRKMQQPPKAKAALQDYGVVELITATLMGLVLVTLVLAALIAPSSARAQPTNTNTVQVMTTKLPQDFSKRLEGSGLSLMRFERLLNVGVEVIEVKDFSSPQESHSLARLEKAFPELEFIQID